MNKLKKALELSLFNRKVILFAVLFILAATMTIIIIRSLTGRVTGFNGKSIFSQFEMDEKLGESFLQIQETKEEIREHIDNMPDMTATNTPTDSFATTQSPVNY